MGRREELEKELEIAEKRLENIPDNIPEEVVEMWHQEADSISFELNNLYDDYETETE